MRIALTINGQDRSFDVAPNQTLLELLRSEGFFSVRFGSETGETGASAVLLDGRLVSTDIMLAAQADGHEIITVESLSRGRDIHPIQAAFVATGALQSGYSTPATVLGTLALLERNPDPSEEDIRDMLSGILDRETAYVKPVEAIKRAAAVMRGEQPDRFGPLILEPMTDGIHPVEVDPDDLPPDASPAVPRLVPSSAVPETEVVGKPVIKVDALKLVKGNPAFVDDIDVRGLLYAKVLRSPHAHARILDIEDSAARASPGVHAVLHYKNTPHIRYASGGQSWPNPKPYDQVSFEAKVRHVGDRVAAVAAETLEMAEEAIRLIEVSYEVLPAVFDENDAIAPGAPVIHDEHDSEGIFDAQRNIARHMETEVGDVEAGFEESDHVFERTFRVHQVQQAPIEPHITIGWFDADERLVFRSSTQVPFHVRRMVAPLLGLTVKDIRVIKPRIGGGFGVKQEMLIEDIVGLLVKATHRPVRLELTREEEFMSSRTRHPQTLTFKTGVMDDGTLVAQELRLVGNTGAYGSHGYTVQNITGLRGLTSYNCPSKRFVCDVAYTNIPVPGAYRGYGAPQAEFALEAHMEDISIALGREVIDFKRQNWVKAGDELNIAPYLGERDVAEEIEDLPVVMTNGIEECVAQGKRAIGWHRRKDAAWKQPADRPHIRRGLGFAFCMHGTGIPFLDMGGCSIKLNDDGSFNVAVGATDLGTGADTVLAQIAAEVLGVQVGDILMYSSDTDHTPFDVGAYASSTTYISGMSVKKSADAVKEQIQSRAAEMLGVKDPKSIDLRKRRAWALDGSSVSIEEVALDSLHWRNQTQIMGTASFMATECPAPFAAQFVEIELDIETGQVTVTKMVMAVDCGVAINPVTASGQVEGGMLQALGYGHCEEMAYDESGRMVNARFGPYKIYRADEMPETEVYLIQTMEESGPFGAKAVAEIPTDGVAPALRGAIIDATGVAIDQIPFTPERVWTAISGS
jgi:putative selenate reductase molybdopterin-binding subunit